MLQQFWVIVGYAGEQTSYYCGYYKNDAPVFKNSLSEALQIATEESAIQLQLHISNAVLCGVEKFVVDE